MRKKFTLVASLAFAAALCAGVATANVTTQAETDWANGLKVSATSVRLGTGTKEDPTGIRFKIDCPVDLRAEEGAEYYTTLSFTADKPYTTNVPATYWRADASGWNTLLLEIPSQYYTMDVTATAVVKLDGQEYTATATSSIAKTASIVMNGGQKDAKLDAFVAGAVTDITLSEATATLQEGETAQLTATTAPAGYGVVWASDAEEVATVAPDGTITAVGAGTANITATMSGVTKTCVVTVKARTLYDFESAEQVALADNFLRIGRDDEKNLTEWAVVEGVGAEDNGVLQAIPSEDYWSRGMQFRVQVAWLNQVFATADYVAFDIYTDASQFQWMRIDKNGGTDQHLQGYNGADSAEITGQLAGTYEGTQLYKFTFAIPKSRYLEAVTVSEGTVNIRLQMVTQPTLWFFDNFNVAGEYDENTLNFADGQANGAIVGEDGTAKSVLSVVEKEPGNYALQGTRGSNDDPCFVMDIDYFLYIFDTLNATSLQYTIYRNGYTKINAGAFRLALNDTQKSTTGVTCVEDKANGKVTVTVSRTAYEQWFTDGEYKGNVSGITKAVSIAFLARLEGGDNIYYIDDFKINR